jgi:hypothetical protein
MTNVPFINGCVVRTISVDESSCPEVRSKKRSQLKKKKTKLRRQQMLARMWRKRNKDCKPV